MNFSGTPVAWNITLLHTEVGQVSSAAYLASIGVPPPVDGILAGAAAFIQAIDAIGGNSGVNVTGVATGQIIATPAGVPLIAGAINLLTHIGNAAWDLAKNAFGSAFRIGVRAFGLGSGHGELHADEDNIGDEERFALITHPNGKISVLANTGYFCADHGRNNEAWANRPAIGGWEEWNMLRQPNGAVSFQTDQGQWLCADVNIGKKLFANRATPQQWEMFNLEYQGDGSVALKSLITNQYISAAP